MEISKTILKEVILDQGEKKTPQYFVARELEEDVRKSGKSGQIVVISGIRRCGKSTLLQIIRSDRKESDYYLNFDDERLIDFNVKDFQLLIEVFLELFGEQKTFYFDEIQNVPGWELFINRLKREGYDIIITGSNASMLSRELGTHLTGRYIEKHLYPFSFAEFLDFKKIEYDKKLVFNTKEKIKIKKLFDQYVRLGGFPDYVKNENGDYLKSLYESIIYRDIIVRYNLPSEKPLKELAHFCASNFGKEISFNALKEVIGLHSSTTVKEYFEYLENSFLVFLLPRFDFSVKKQVYLNKKAYFGDMALAKNIGFYFSDDSGRILENIVFLHLKRKNKEIYFHKKNKECDFILKEGNKIVKALQIAKSLKNKKTKEREIAGLIEAMEEYKLKSGLIITEDEEDEIKINNSIIFIKPIYKWLLEQ